MPPNAAKKHTALHKGGTAMAGSGATSTPPMHQPKDLRNTPTTDREQRPTDPGPTTGGMGSVGSQPDEPSLEEKLGMDAQPGPMPDMYSDPTERELRRH